MKGRDAIGASHETSRSFDGDRVEWLFDKLRTDIMSGRLVPGQKISEPQIAKRFNMSRAPIREAIRRLEERQLAIRSPRAGVRVVKLSQENADDLVMMREYLEGLAARLAAEKMSAGEVATLRTIVESRTTDLAASDASSYSIPARDFHSAIAKGSGSGELERLLCKDYFFRFRLLYQTITWTPEIGLRGQIEHRHIVSAIESRDGELAELLMRRHVVASMGRYLKQSAG